MNHYDHPSPQQNNDAQTSESPNNTQQENCTIETCTMEPCPMKTESKAYQPGKCPACGKSHNV